MPTQTLRRLERILTMVPWLLERPGISLDATAARFGTDPAELAEDLDVLGYCGVPGYGGGDLIEVSVVGDRVVVRMADYFRRPLRLSVREAMTLVLAARALGGVEGLAESASLRSALGKLEGALDVGGAAGGPQVAVDVGSGDERLTLLRRAVEGGQVVHLVYRSASKAEITERDVEPWAVTAAGGEWYLQGWCRLARAPRDFRLDRVAELRVTDETVTAPPSEPAPPAYQPAADDLQVVLDLEQPAWWVAEWAVIDDQSHPHAGVKQVRLRTSHLEWVARLVLRLGTDVRVVAPDELRVRVGQLARETLRRYERAAV